MSLFPYGLLLAFLSLTVAMLIWQRIANWSFLAMGFTTHPPPDLRTIRPKLLAFLWWASGIWSLGFAGVAATVAVLWAPSNVWVYLLSGAAAVPLLVVPNALRTLRRIDCATGERSAT